MFEFSAWELSTLQIFTCTFVPGFAWTVLVFMCSFYLGLVLVLLDGPKIKILHSLWSTPKKRTLETCVAEVFHPHRLTIQAWAAVETFTPEGLPWDMGERRSSWSNFLYHYRWLQVYPYCQCRNFANVKPVPLEEIDLVIVLPTCEFLSWVTWILLKLSGSARVLIPRFFNMLTSWANLGWWWSTDLAGR